MKQNGVRQDDPEFIKAYNLLVAISQQSQLRKLRAQQQQETLARQQRLQQEGSGAQQTTNGIHGKMLPINVIRQYNR